MSGRSASGVELTTDRWFAFPAEPALVWEAMCATDRYREWWPWLTGFEADGLHDGAVWRCAVRSWWRMTLRFDVAIERAGESQRTQERLFVVAAVSGDLEGTATLSIRQNGRASAVRLVATIRPASQRFRVLASISPTLAGRAHDRILRTGAEQFAAALRARA